MLKKSLIVMTALVILMSVPVVASTPQTDTDDLKKKKTIDEMLRLKSHGWPADIDFKWFTLEDFKVPVYMDVGLFLEILNIKEVMDEGILLEQVKIDKYVGCSLPFKIKCNFDLKLGGKIEVTEAGYAMMRDKYSPGDSTPQEKNDDKDDFWDVDIVSTEGPCDKAEKAEKVQATYCERIEERRIRVEFEDATIVHVPFGKEAHVADVYVRVKPDIDLDWDQWEISRKFELPETVDP